MGLINTVGNLASQAGNLQQLGDDFLGSLKKSILGQDNTASKYSNETNALPGIDGLSSKSKSFNDLRGVKSVYRSTSDTLSGAGFQQIYHMDRDFCWTQHAYGNSFADFKPQVQRIKIVEFQPFQQTFLGQAFYTFLNTKKGNGDLKTNAMGAMGGVGQGLKDQPLVGQFGKIMKNIMINNFSKNPQTLYKDDSYDIAQKDPFDAITRMFVDGLWLHTYVIPLLGSQNYTFLHQSGKQFDGLKGGGGQFGALVGMLGGSKAAGQMKGADGMWKNVPSTPNFTAKLQARPGISTTFYLINKTSQDLVKNYRFLMAFAAGTYNVQLQWGAMQSPNVYYVEILGKRQMIWAQMQVSASEIGKYRYDQYAYEKIAEQTAYNNDGLFKKQNNNSYTSVLWPQAWQVKVTIDDFTPNTFNTIQHYLRYGSCLKSLYAKTRNYGQVYQKVQAKMKEKNAKKQAAKK